MTYEQWKTAKIALFTELAVFHETAYASAKVHGPAQAAEWHSDAHDLIKEAHQWFDNNSEAIWESEN